MARCETIEAAMADVDHAPPLRRSASTCLPLSLRGREQDRDVARAGARSQTPWPRSSRGRRARDGDGRSPPGGVREATSLTRRAPNAAAMSSARGLAAEAERRREREEHRTRHEIDDTRAWRSWRRQASITSGGRFPFVSASTSASATGLGRRRAQRRAAGAAGPSARSTSASSEGAPRRARSRAPGLSFARSLRTAIPTR